MQSNISNSLPGKGFPHSRGTLGVSKCMFVAASSEQTAKLNN